MNMLYYSIVPLRILCIAVLLCLMTLCANTARAQGALTNGAAHDGAISVAAETDTWTIAANKGDRLILQVAELTGGAGFTPTIEVFAPDGTRLAIDSDALAARVDIQAHVTGTFTAVVRDFNQTGTGTYRLRLAKVPGAFIVPAGDDGGALVNGTKHQGTIDRGDLDLWTITANAGDRITVQIAELTGGAGFTPMIELFAPDGARLEEQRAAPAVAHATFAAETVTRALVGRTVADVERDLILETLKHCLGNRTHAANILGISIRTLRIKLNEYADGGIPITPAGAGDYQRAAVAG